MIRRALLLSTLFAGLAACGQNSSQRLDPQQQATLNQIAANTSDTAGSEALQNGASPDVGQAYRSGAAAPPRRY